MKLDRLLALTRNPELLSADESQDLETLVQEYPYFSAAQLLLTIKYKQQNTSRFNRQLQKAAAHLPDKNVLAAALHEDLAHMQQLAAMEAAESELEGVIVKEEIEAVRPVVGEAEMASLDMEDVAAEVIEEDIAVETAVATDVHDSISAQISEDAFTGILVETATPTIPENSFQIETAIVVEEAEQSTVSDELPQVVDTVEATSVIESEVSPGTETAHPNEEVIHTQVDTVDATPANAPVQEFLTSAHDRLSWFRFFAGKPLREQPADVLEELYLEHMSGDFLKADAASFPEIKSDLKAVINHEPEVAQNKNLEEEIRRLAYESISDEELPASETLAAIYESQKDYKKALRIYQKLMLKFPDRMTYFAGLIASTKEKLNN